MQLIIAVNCSARKTATTSKELRASSLPKGVLAELAAEWLARVASVTTRVRADVLYGGRTFALAKKIAGSARADLHILSAGMGLVRHDALIPAYDLSVTRGTKECILNRARKGAEFSPQQWWQAVHSSSSVRTRIADLLCLHPRALALIAANRAYIDMVADEVGGLGEELLRRVRIVGIKQSATLEARLRPYVMPYDARLNDRRFPLKGTEFDYPARALTHFIKLVNNDTKLGSAQDHARRVRQSLAHYSAPKRITRKRIRDALLEREVAAFKRQRLSQSNALDALRQMGLACEQRRFSRAWTVIKARDD